MRRLFICLIALSIGVCTFTSCTDKEKDDLKDSGKGGREKSILLQFSLYPSSRLFFHRRYQAWVIGLSLLILHRL